MRSLFLKIFVWFWIVQILIGAVMFTLTTALRFEPDLGRQHPETTFALNQIARSAAAAYQSGGAQPLSNNLHQVRRETRIRTWFFNDRGRELSGAPVPKAQLDAARAVANKALQTGGRGPGFVDNASPSGASPDGTDDLNANVVQSPQGEHFVLVSEIKRPPPRGFSPGFAGDLMRPHGNGAVRLLALLLSSGLLCYGLARYLTAPAVKLRRATRQLASGDLSARVGAQMGRRRDELADLGRDFDQMAERIETLMLSERRLLGDISHELRSPLARMTVALDLMEDMTTPEAQPDAPVESSTRSEMQPYLARIRRESERLNALIGQLLTLSRLETGIVRVEETPVDLSALLRDIVQDADFEARGRNRQVRMTNCEALWTSGAPELLHSAIENVVRNAVRYTPENTTVEVSLVREEAQALIRVLDCGPGVPQNALENLFRPFYRVADARDRQSGGTGLGLAITERAVRLHGGHVAAFNAPKGGLLVEMRFAASDELQM